MSLRWSSAIAVILAAACSGKRSTSPQDGASPTAVGSGSDKLEYNECPIVGDQVSDEARVTRVRRALQPELAALVACDPDHQSIDLEVMIDPQGKLGQVCVGDSSTKKTAECIARHLGRDLGAGTIAALAKAADGKRVAVQMPIFHLADPKPQPPGPDGKPAMVLDMGKMARESRCPLDAYRTANSPPLPAASASQRAAIQKAVDGVATAASACRADDDRSALSVDVGLTMNADGGVDRPCVTKIADRLTEDCVVRYINTIHVEGVGGKTAEHLTLALPAR